MSPTQKKTLGAAIASLVFGCLILIPVLGVIFSIAAIVLGIVALGKISKNAETLKGQGLAVSGIVLGVTGIFLIPVIAMFAAIAIPNFLRAKVKVNEANAKAALQEIAVAAERYAAEHNGELPVSIYNLVTQDPPYLDEHYSKGRRYGYKFKCEFGPSGFECEAIPESCPATGTKTYTIDESGEFFISGCSD